MWRLLLHLLPAFLPLLLSVLVCIVGQSYRQQARDYAWQQAELAQRLCLQQQACARQLPGWQQGVMDSAFSRQTVTVGYVPFWLFYQASEKRFQISISEGPESAFRIQGGVDVGLELWPVQQRQPGVGEA